MVPYKRAAGDKSGVPVYQQSAATAYQQLLQPFVPVSCEYRLPPSTSAFSTTAANAAAFTGISLNKQAIPQTPHSAAAAAVAAAAAASMPRYHTSTAGQLNQAFAHHFFPQLTAAGLRHASMSAGPPTIPGFPPGCLTNPTASTHLSELLAAAQFSTMTNNNSNIQNNNNGNNNANSISSHGSSNVSHNSAIAAAAAVAAAAAAASSSNSSSSNTIQINNSNSPNNNIMNNSNSASVGTSNDEDSQPYKKLKTV